ncbi:MAG: hypothetical protein K2G40_09110, partial [Muribaculaceae bacterium]|nr:hypothetical protein [Muribaculaceae bacterium]
GKEPTPTVEKGSGSSDRINPYMDEGDDDSILIDDEFDLKDKKKKPEKVKEVKQEKSSNSKPGKSKSSSWWNNLRSKMGEMLNENDEFEE